MKIFDMEIHPNVMMSCILLTRLTKQRYTGALDMLMFAINYVEKAFKRVNGADKKEIVIQALTSLKDFIPENHLEKYNELILDISKTIDFVVSIANNKNFKVFVKKCLH